MNFNYTDVYNSIYKEIKREFIPHEKAHYAALKISDAIMDIYLLTREKEEGLQKLISETVSSMLESAELSMIGSSESE